MHSAQEAIIRLGVILICTLASGCPSAHQYSAALPPGTVAKDSVGVTAVLDSMATGWNRGDLDLYLTGYSDDATSRGMDGFVHGKNGARQVMLDGFWKSGRPTQLLHYEHVSVRDLGTSYALATGEFVLTGAGRPDRRGWFTTVWIKTGTSWRCIHDHS